MQRKKNAHQCGFVARLLVGCILLIATSCSVAKAQSPSSSTADWALGSVTLAGKIGYNSTMTLNWTKVLYSTSTEQHSVDTSSALLRDVLFSAQQEFPLALHVVSGVSMLGVATLSSACSSAQNLDAIAGITNQSALGALGVDPRNHTFTSSIPTPTSVSGIAKVQVAILKRAPHEIIEDIATAVITLWFRVRVTSYAHALTVQRRMDALQMDYSLDNWAPQVAKSLDALATNATNPETTHDDLCDLCSPGGGSNATNAANTGFSTSFCVIGFVLATDDLLEASDTPGISPGSDQSGSSSNSVATAITVILIVLAVVVIAGLFFWHIVRHKMKELKTKQKQDRASKYKEDENSDYWKKVKESTDKILGKPVDDVPADDGGGGGGGAKEMEMGIANSNGEERWNSGGDPSAQVEGEERDDNVLAGKRRRNGKRSSSKKRNSSSKEEAEQASSLAPLSSLPPPPPRNRHQAAANNQALPMPHMIASPTRDENGFSSF